MTVRPVEIPVSNTRAQRGKIRPASGLTTRRRGRDNALRPDESRFFPVLWHVANFPP